MFFTLKYKRVFFLIKSWLVRRSIRTNSLSQQWLHGQQRLYSPCASFHTSFKTCCSDPTNLPILPARHAEKPLSHHPPIQVILAKIQRYKRTTPAPMTEKQSGLSSSQWREKPYALINRTAYCIWIHQNKITLSTAAKLLQKQRTAASNQLTHTVVPVFLNTDLHLYPIFRDYSPRTA